MKGRSSISRIISTIVTAIIISTSLCGCATTTAKDTSEEDIRFLLEQSGVIIGEAVHSDESDDGESEYVYQAGEYALEEAEKDGGYVKIIYHGHEGGLYKVTVLGVSEDEDMVTGEDMNQELKFRYRHLLWFHVMEPYEET